MAPNQETLIASSYLKAENNTHKPPARLSMESLKRTISDISFELTIKEALPSIEDDDHNLHVIKQLPTISDELEEAMCECCGMCEECTPEYIGRVRDEFLGKLICGLCGEAAKEEMEKNGWKIEEALQEHMSVCVRFNRLGRAYPVLYQAEAMREMLKKSSSNTRAKSMSPRDKGVNGKLGGLVRSSSCIPAILRNSDDRKVVN